MSDGVGITCSVRYVSGTRAPFKQKRFKFYLIWKKTLTVTAPSGLNICLWNEVPVETFLLNDTEGKASTRKKQKKKMARAVYSYLVSKLTARGVDSKSQMTCSKLWICLAWRPWSHGDVLFVLFSYQAGAPARSHEEIFCRKNKSKWLEFDELLAAGYVSSWVKELRVKWSHFFMCRRFSAWMNNMRTMETSMSKSVTHSNRSSTWEGKKNHTHALNKCAH